MIDVSKEKTLLHDELLTLHRNIPSIKKGIYKKDSQIYSVLGVFVDVSSRLRAIEAKENEREFDPFELERPVNWVVVVVKCGSSFAIIKELPHTIRADNFEKDFQPILS